MSNKVPNQAPTDRQLKTEQSKFWLQQKVNEILEPMMLATVQANPDNNVKFMLQYLEERFGERAT